MTAEVRSQTGFAEDRCRHEGLVEAPRAQTRPERGFSLVELLVAIVLVGILTAVAVVGLSGLTSTSDKSSCKTVLGAAQAATATYYASTGAYPTTFTAMTTGPSAVFTPPSGVTATGSVMSTSKWSVTMSGGGGTTPNTFTKTGGGAPCS